MRVALVVAQQIKMAAIVGKQIFQVVHILLFGPVPPGPEGHAGEKDGPSSQERRKYPVLKYQHGKVGHYFPLYPRLLNLRSLSG